MTCECAERAVNLSRIYETRRLEAAEAGQPETAALARQVREDLAALAANCEESS